MMKYIIYLQSVQKQPGECRNPLRKLVHKPKQKSSQRRADRHWKNWVEPCKCRISDPSCEFVELAGQNSLVTTHN